MAEDRNQRSKLRRSFLVSRLPVPSRTSSTGIIAVVASLILAIGSVSVDAIGQAEQKDRGDKARQETTRLHSDLVVINVTVTDSEGQYAHGLASKNFSILEDGVPQKIDSFTAEEAPFAAAILMDMSGSMEYRFGLVRGAAASFIESIREDDQVALYGFNDQVRLFQDFTNTRYITDYVWDAEARDNTRLYDCMAQAIEALAKRPEKRRVILMISDGWDTGSHKATMDSVIKNSHSAGITVYTVDLIDEKMLQGSGRYGSFLRRGRSEMREFATQTGGRYVAAPDGANLEQSFSGIIDELRNQYTLTYYSSNEKRDGRWRKISVTLSKPELMARTRRGYFGPKN